MEIENKNLLIIDDLLKELNEVALVKFYTQYLYEKNAEIKALQSITDQTNNIKDITLYHEYLSANEVLTSKKTELENLLFDLGVKKADPNNENEMLKLSELLNEDVYESYQFYMSNQNPQETQSGFNIATNNSPTDFYIFASLFSIYYFDGNYSYGGSSYEYRTVYVIDDKGSNFLTINEEFNAIPYVNAGTTLAQLLSYTFQFILLELIAKTPYGMITNWTIGAIDVLNDYPPSSVIASGNTNIYRIFSNSVTLMYYFYINYNGWKHIGT